jgi:hypothetical protein
MSDEIRAGGVQTSQLWIESHNGLVGAPVSRYSSFKLTSGLGSTTRLLDIKVSCRQGWRKESAGADALPYTYAILRIWIVPFVHSPGFPPGALAGFMHVAIHRIHHGVRMPQVIIAGVQADLSAR